MWGDMEGYLDAERVAWDIAVPGCRGAGQAGQRRAGQGRAGQGRAAAGQKPFHPKKQGKNSAQSPTNLRTQTLHNFHKPSTLSQS